MALVDIANGKSRHVHYRDSKLTFLLRVSIHQLRVTITVVIPMYIHVQCMFLIQRQWVIVMKYLLLCSSMAECTLYMYAHRFRIHWVCTVYNHVDYDKNVQSLSLSPPYRTPWEAMPRPTWWPMSIPVPGALERVSPHLTLPGEPRWSRTRLWSMRILLAMCSSCKLR